MHELYQLLALVAACLSVIAFRRVSAAGEEIEVLKKRLHNLENQRQSSAIPDPLPEPRLPLLRRESAPQEAIKTGIPDRRRPVASEIEPEVMKAAPPVSIKLPGNYPLKTSSPVKAEPILPPINWEHFMGAKLFAWLGGLALFLGIAFFVKYSFEHNLIPPALKMMIGSVVGISLMVGGVRMKKKAYAVTSQTLCATGVVILYTVVFGCYALYHFAAFGPATTFLLMSGITTVAFILAVRQEALVVAVLGILGGFLTPVLLPVAQGNPLFLFGYLALLDVGLVCVALARPWRFLTLLAAVGTFLTQLAWTAGSFRAGHYFAGNRILSVMAIALGFQLIFVIAAAWEQRKNQLGKWLSGSALGMSAVPFLSVFYFFDFVQLTERPLLIFSYAFIADLILLLLLAFRKCLAFLYSVAGIILFIELMIWTASYLHESSLNIALLLYFVFAVFHTGVPQFMIRKKYWVAGSSWDHCFPALALLLSFITILHSGETSFSIWIFILIMDVLAIAVAAFTSVLLPVGVVLVLTMLALGLSILKIPVVFTGLPSELFLVAGFGVFFVAATVWIGKKLNGSQTSVLSSKFASEFGIPISLENPLPAMSAVLPFILLIMVTMRLPLVNPTPIFGIALLLVALLLGVARFLQQQLLIAVGFGAVIFLEYAWWGNRFSLDHSVINLTWHLGFYAVFLGFPFFFKKAYAEKSLPWAVAALSGPLHFPIIYDIVKHAWPNPVMGLLPTAFIFPSLAGFKLVQSSPLLLVSPKRNTQLAWFGGVVLLFVSLIFPIQFDRQWLTVAWALEGTALCWLFNKIPHPGLRLVGVSLLIIVFSRLALNPAVLGYHPRATIGIFNWYLYTYGIVIAAIFLAARLLAPPRELVMGSNVRPILYSLGVVLAFLLVNIEIADWFTPSGRDVLTFSFSGNFARDMSYSIAWALFSLMLLIIGITKKAAPMRYAALGLLGITLLKLFFYDLAELGQLYRIGALIIVAIIAMLASFLYQRFLAASTDSGGSSSS